MPERTEAVNRLCAKGVVAVVRAPGSEALLHVARALLDGGVDCIEITMTTPNATRVIRDCRKEFAEAALIGVGSVLNETMAVDAVEAGAQFLVSPVFKPEIVGVAHMNELPAIPGALTPTEVLLASDAGAELVKVFPGEAVGPKYLKALRAPMPHLKLTPTGGVDLNTAASWIAAGAATLGVGSAMVTKKALAEKDYGEITRLAGEFVRIVAEAREASRP